VFLSEIAEQLTTLGMRQQHAEHRCRNRRQWCVSPALVVRHAGLRATLDKVEANSTMSNFAGLDDRAGRKVAGLDQNWTTTVVD